MASKTRVNGTAYDIKGGMTRINGTAYSIKSGMTRVNGTAYTISLGGKTITISNTLGSYGMAYLNNYGLGNGTSSFKDTDTLKVYVGGDSSYSSYARVFLNDSVVKTGAGYYTLSNISQYKTITIKFEYKNYNTYGWCYITTT